MRRTIAILGILAVTAAACGGGDDAAEVATLESTTTSTTATTVQEQIDTETALLAFVECLREQGIDVPDPSVDAAGNPQFTEPPDLSDVDPDDLRAAQDACSDEIEQVTLGFLGTDLTGVQDRLLEYASCMRENGFDLPDPDFSNLAAQEGPFGDVDLDDPDFLAADAVCRELLADLLP